MNDLTPETISCYADGELSAEECVQVEQALRDDPLLAAELDEMEDLAAYFGHIEPEAVPEELTERLYAIDTPVITAFEPVDAAVVRPTPRTWLSWAAPLAAAVLVGIGALTMMLERPEVELREFARLGVNANTGKLEELKTFPSVKRRVGDRVRAAADERITFRFSDGSEVVLLPKTEIQLRDPSEGALFSLSEGTVLCTMLESGRDREVDAGGFPIRADGAIFGVRCEPARIKTAGPSFGGDASARITVAVGRGNLEVAENGDREFLSAGDRVVMQRGHETEHSAAHADPIFAGLYEAFPHLGRRIMEGYYEGSSVTRIYSRRFVRENGRLTLVVTDTGEAGRAAYLAFEVKTNKPSALRVTRVMPVSSESAESGIQTATITTKSVGDEWTVLSIPLSSFDAEEATRGERAVASGRSRLVRLEIAAVEEGASLRLRTALWADHAPIAPLEVIR